MAPPGWEVTARPSKSRRPAGTSLAGHQTRRDRVTQTVPPSPGPRPSPSLMARQRPALPAGRLSPGPARLAGDANRVSLLPQTYADLPRKSGSRRRPVNCKVSLPSLAEAGYCTVLVSVVVWSNRRTHSQSLTPSWVEHARPWPAASRRVERTNAHHRWSPSSFRAVPQPFSDEPVASLEPEVVSSVRLRRGRGYGTAVADRVARPAPATLIAAPP